MMTVIVKGSGMSLNSREKMIVAAQELLSERGYAGTSFGDVIERSGAPRGSIYHHFPEGKQQLVTEAVQRYAAGVLAAIAKAERETSEREEKTRELASARRTELHNLAESFEIAVGDCAHITARICVHGTRHLTFD